MKVDFSFNTKVCNPYLWFNPTYCYKLFHPWKVFRLFCSRSAELNQIQNVNKKPVNKSTSKSLRHRKYEKFLGYVRYINLAKANCIRADIPLEHLSPELQLLTFWLSSPPPLLVLPLTFNVAANSKLLYPMWDILSFI